MNAKIKRDRIVSDLWLSRSNWTGRFDPIQTFRSDGIDRIGIIEQSNRQMTFHMAGSGLYIFRILKSITFIKEDTTTLFQPRFSRVSGFFV